MKYYGWVFLFFIAAYLLPLAGRPMVTPDEFRYAEIPREMMESGQYAAPHLLNMRYFEKPVLGYWMTAACFRIFGENSFALRFPAALGAGLAALFIGILLHQVFRDDKIAALGAGIYLTFGMVYGIGTFAVLDSQLTGFVTGISCSAFLAVMEKSFNRRKAALLVICGIFAALAFMTKGFVAFAVPGLAVFGFLLWERRWKEFWQLPWIPLGVMLLVVAPWAIAVHRAEPDYWRYFIEVEHIQRFTSSSGEQHSEPFWFLVPFLAAGIFPGGLLLSAAIPGIRREGSGFFRQPLVRFSVCSVVLPFLFFSASSGKLATYILPCFPFLAVLGALGIAAYFRSGGEHSLYRWTMTGWGILLGLAGIGVLVIACFNLIPEFESKRVMAGVLGVCGILAGGALALSWRGVWRTRFYLFFGGIALLVMVGGWTIPDTLLGSKAPEDGLLKLEKELKFDREQAIFITHPTFMHAVAWVYRRPDVRLLASSGELAYGIKEAKEHGETPVRMEWKEFNELLLQSNRPDVIYITREERDLEYPEGVEVRILAASEMQAYYFPGGKRKD